MFSMYVQCSVIYIPFTCYQETSVIVLTKLKQTILCYLHILKSNPDLVAGVVYRVLFTCAKEIRVVRILMDLQVTVL
jgi:hypothetical protein